MDLYRSASEGLNPHSVFLMPGQCRTSPCFGEGTLRFCWSRIFRTGAKSFDRWEWIEVVLPTDQSALIAPGIYGRNRR
jgi:hypothetical protein